MEKPKVMNEKAILKAILKKNNLAQKDFAKKIDVEPKILTNQLNQVATINLGTLYALLDALGYDIVIRGRKERGDSQEYVIADNNDAIEIETMLGSDAEAIETAKADNAAAMLKSLK